jgi:hypothetical protein
MGLLFPSSGRSKSESVILQFPSSRRYAVRVEREIGDLGGWLTILDAVGDLHGDFASAMAEARKMANKFNLTIWSSAGRFPC